MNDNHLHNDQYLLKQLIAGEESAFRIFYDRYWNRIYSTVLAFTQSHHMAMDVVQDTFSMLWTRRQKLVAVENIEAYIFTSGRNRMMTLLKNQKDFVPADILNSRPQNEEQLSPERQAALRQFSEKIRQAIELLPSRQAEVFKLSRLEGHSYEEIAEIMGISRDTVRNHLIKALSFMRSHFQNRNEELLFLLFFVSFL